ncbi:MAG: Gfo/Idh/MocA family oxidoreductase [Cyclobacteriaceae bacterium]|nr:Gfo/Idh/MocA family oxidoreductase [Cyclobacteriaceae bacterium]
MLPFASTAGAFDGMVGNDQALKPIRIGIIGAENSHTVGFGRMFNMDKVFPGVSVTHVWGETEELARAAMEKGNIPAMVSHPGEMLGKIDALIVDHRHGKFHLKAATPFVQAGIPTFIDKPFCYRLAEGKEFLAMARELGTPVTSYSSVAHSEATFDRKAQLENLGDINQVVCTGPVDLDSEYGGVFFYGPHLIEPVLYMFGTDIKKVRVTNNGKNSGASLVYGNGRLITLVFTTKNYGWHTFVETSEGMVEMVELTSRVEGAAQAKNDADMVTMFRTGAEPRTHQSILAGVAVLEALEKSIASDRWEDVEPVL